jgi:OFA family oxalate/formate antiporter-like MFS transporter
MKIHNRWFQLCASLLAMIMIGNLQYAWTLFVKPIQQGTGWKLSAIQYAATLFLLFQSLTQPAQGWLIDRLGPRLFFSIGAVFCGAGWAGLGHAATLPALYSCYALAGIGAALVYSGSIGSSLKWFSNKRGLAIGIMAAGFGGGAALFIPFISSSIRDQGYRATFVWSGILQGLIILIVAQFLRFPPAQPAAKTTEALPAPRLGRHQYSTREMLATAHFYFLYAAFFMMMVGGLLLTLNAGPIAAAWGIGAAVLATTASMNALASGFSRIFWGWISDHAGRESTMVVVFACNAASLLLFAMFGRTSGTWFVVTDALVLFTWGEIYVLFPATIGDYYGKGNATSNCAVLYSGKGLASIISGGIAALLFEHFGTWSACLYGSALLALLAAGIAYGLKASAPEHAVAMASEATSA